MYRVGIIGCGGIVTGKHVRELAQEPRAEVTAICDASPEALELAVAALDERDMGKPHSYSDYLTMLESEELDVVLVATPHAMHFANCRAAIESGAHVLLEKPAAATISEARALRKASRERGVLCGIAYQRHVGRPYRWLYKAVREGRIGQLQFLELVIAQNWKVVATGWRKDPALSVGGYLFDTGSHIIALLLWLTGWSPAAVSAFVDYEKPGIDTNAAVSVSFKEGCLANITFCGAAAEGWYDRATIWGRTATVALGPEGLSISDGSGPSRQPEDLADVTESTTIGNLLDAIEKRDNLGADLFLAEKVLRLTRAIYKSARTGEVVKLS